MTTYGPDTDELSGGEWVRNGLVWHWVETETPEPEDDRPDYFPGDLIACPFCLARMDEGCRTSDGRSHSTRLVKRVCSCGGSICPNEPMCGFCRAEASREVAA